MATWICGILLCLLYAQEAAAADWIVESGPQRVHLLELYTSEGCSSCPPAEEWLNALGKSPELWRSVVPVALHVDYWDNLGWPDRFARREFTQRQERYKALWGARSIYTPEFVLDGVEWRRGTIPKAGPDAPGVLKARLTSHTLRIDFAPKKDATAARAAWVAVLQNPPAVPVKAGENAGRTLEHNYVVMGLMNSIMSQKAGVHSAALRMDGKLLKNAHGLAVWVTPQGRMTVEQSAGGFFREGHTVGLPGREP